MRKRSQKAQKESKRMHSLRTYRSTICNFFILSVFWKKWKISKRLLRVIGGQRVNEIKEFCWWEIWLQLLIEAGLRSRDHKPRPSFAYTAFRTHCSPISCCINTSAGAARRETSTPNITTKSPPTCCCCCWWWWWCNDNRGLRDYLRISV